MQLTCYAWSVGEGQWEAICTDLDIAAQGCSLEDAKKELEDAVDVYIDFVMTLPEDEIERFLKRKSPLWLRLRLDANYRVSGIRRLLRLSQSFAEPWVVEAPAS